MAETVANAMVNTDLEGPWVTADHAHAVALEAIQIPDDPMIGAKLFEKISLLDDAFYYVLIAFGANEKLLKDVAIHESKYIEGAVPSMKRLVTRCFDPFVISTSYQQYVHHVVPPMGVHMNQMSCTYFPLDFYLGEVNEEDKGMMFDIANDMVREPNIDVDENSWWGEKEDVRAYGSS